MSGRPNTEQQGVVVVTPEQDARLVKAIGVLMAKQAAIRAGVPPAELNSYDWLVHVDPVREEPQQQRLAGA